MYKTAKLVAAEIIYIDIDQKIYIVLYCILYIDKKIFHIY